MARKQAFDYFDAFSRQAQIAAKESQALVDLLKDYRPDDASKSHFQAIHEFENEADQVAHDILNHLAVEFMPPIDREDVSELCSLLDDVNDLIDEVVQHLYMFNIQTLHPMAARFAVVIDEAVDALAEAAANFRDFKKPKKLDGFLVAVHDREAEGDKLYMEAKRDLFVNHADAPASYLIAWNSMFSHMERCCDACERVATAMQTIQLKNT